MNKNLLWIAAAVAGISAAYVFVMRDEREKTLKQDDHASDAQWANEGGANAPASV
jgi:hypothetical protein